MLTAAILTVSDMGSQGKREDTSGQAIADVLSAHDFRIVRRGIVPDESEIIRERLIQWCDAGDVDLVVTTGGTGLGLRDVTPEATSAVIERPVPGISEAMRMDTLKKTPMSMISRGVSGVRKRCLIVNLPGSTKAVRECLDIVLPVIPHAVQLLKGQTSAHPTS